MQTYRRIRVFWQARCIRAAPPLLLPECSVLANPHAHPCIHARRIRVFWPADRTFFEGWCTDYYPASEEGKVSLCVCGGMHVHAHMQGAHKAQLCEGKACFGSASPHKCGFLRMRQALAAPFYFAQPASWIHRRRATGWSMTTATWSSSTCQKRSERRLI